MPPGSCIIVLHIYLHTPTQFNAPVIFCKGFLAVVFLLSQHPFYSSGLLMFIKKVIPKCIRFILLKMKF